MFTFNVEATAVLVPTFQTDLVAQNGEESFKLFATAFFCFSKKKKKSYLNWQLNYQIIRNKQTKKRTIAKHFIVGCLSSFGVEDTEFEIDRTFLFFQQQ